MRSIWQSLYLFRIQPLRGVEPPIRQWAVRAARGGRSARRAWWVVLVVAGLGLLAGQGLAATAIAYRVVWNEWWGSVNDIFVDEPLGEASGTWWLLIAVAGIAATVLELVVLRLLWLRASTKRALMRRDRCATCGHGLAGVPVGSGDVVRCPECAAETLAVEAWNELDRTAPERPVFAPARGLVKRFWTRRRVVLSGKLCAALVLLCLLGYGGWWTVREIQIRRDAAIAREERADIVAINSLIRGDPIHLDPTRPTLIDLMNQIKSKAEAVQSAFNLEHKELIQTLGIYSPDPSYVTFRQYLSDDERVADTNRTLSRELVERMRDDGLFELIDRLPGANHSSSFSFAPVDAGAELGHGGVFRATVRLCLARMRIAYDTRDLEEFTAAQSAAAAVTQTAFAGPMLIDWLVATACGDMQLQASTVILINRPEREWLSAVESGAASLRPIPLARSMKFEQIWAEDAVSWAFSDPARIRQGLGSAELYDHLGVGGARGWSLWGNPSDEFGLRLGRYAENRDGIRKSYADFIRATQLNSWERASALADLGPASDLAIVENLSPRAEIVLRTADRFELRRCAVDVMIALERHLLEMGAYPNSLAELPPDSAAAKVIDPFSGKSFGYRRIDAESDEFGRGYLLWTVGLDGEDNEGLMEKPHSDRALRPSSIKVDMILNDPRW